MTCAIDPAASVMCDSRWANAHVKDGGLLLHAKGDIKHFSFEAYATRRSFHTGDTITTEFFRGRVLKHGVRWINRQGHGFVLTDTGGRSLVAGDSILGHTNVAKLKARRAAARAAIARASVRRTADCAPHGSEPFLCDVTIAQNATRRVTAPSDHCGFRDFQAAPASSQRVGAAFHDASRRPFVLSSRDVTAAPDFHRTTPLNIAVTEQPKHLELQNHSAYTVEVTFSTSCRTFAVR